MILVNIKKLEGNVGLREMRQISLKVDFFFNFSENDNSSAFSKDVRGAEAFIQLHKKTKFSIKDFFQ